MLFELVLIGLVHLYICIKGVRIAYAAALFKSEWKMALSLFYGKNEVERNNLGGSREVFLLREKERACRSPRRMRGYGIAHPTKSNLTVASRARGVIPRGVKIKPWEASCFPKGEILARRTGQNCGLCRLSAGRVASRRVGYVFSVCVKGARVFALKFME